MFPTCNSPRDIQSALKKPSFVLLLILLVDCIMKSQDCVVITQRSSTTVPAKITSGQEGKDGRKEGEGGRPRREEVEEGSCKQTPFTHTSGDTVAGARFWRNKKSTSDGSGFCLIIPSSVLPCVGSERSCWCVREESGPNWGLTTYARWLLDCIVWWPTKPYTSKKLRCACDCRCFTSPLSYCTSRELI